jgi:7,8-dihydroneopterin aldolase/epimerase/oxygenase
MSDEIPLAFAPLVDRVMATTGPVALDRISLTDLERAVEIGAFQQERGIVQRLRFSIVAEVHSAAEDAADDVDQILSYDALSEAVDAELAAERLNLLETLAVRIADRILAHPLAARCFLRIEKLDRGPYVLGVEIVRSASDRLAADPDTPRPLVIYLSDAAAQRPDLNAALDRLTGQVAPLILCVGPGACTVARVDDAAAQRRIDLLEIEQNAWALAARDARCVIAASRTELDWGLKNGLVSVWAPSKLVLDSFDSPKTTTGEALALWLAGQFRAEKMICFGGSVPASDIIDISQLPAT